MFIRSGEAASARPKVLLCHSLPRLCEGSRIESFGAWALLNIIHMRTLRASPTKDDRPYLASTFSTFTAAYLQIYVAGITWAYFAAAGARWHDNVRVHVMRSLLYLKKIIAKQCGAFSCDLPRLKISDHSSVSFWLLGKLLIIFSSALESGRSS